MLQIYVPMEPELWDEEKEEFITPKCQELQLEHSLISLSKWESKWHVPFLSDRTKTDEETLDYIRCMTLNHVPAYIYNHLTKKNIKEIIEYIQEPMTATTFRKEEEPKKKEIYTAEVLYYYMIAFHIPFECRKWHLNQLITLIHVCAAKCQPKKKNRSKGEIAASYAEMNARRRKEWNTEG